MAIAAIYIILAMASFLLYLGFWKEDAWIIVFGSSILIFAGLHAIINQFQDIIYPYSYMFGVTFIFIGAYLMTRTVMEVVQNNM